MPYTIHPEDVISILNSAKVNFVLVGLYGLAGWMDESRATQDVDLIVASRQHKKAISCLLARFPELEVNDLPVVTRLRDKETEKVLIDVMKPNQPLMKAVFENTKAIHRGGHPVKIPNLEMAIAMKFAPMISLNRQEEDKYQDAHDFILMIKANSRIDAKKLAELGDLVYEGGGVDLLEYVRRVRAGEKLLL